MVWLQREGYFAFGCWGVVCERQRLTRLMLPSVAMCRPEISFLIGPPSSQFHPDRNFFLGSVSRGGHHKPMFGKRTPNGTFVRGKCLPATVLLTRGCVGCSVDLRLLSCVLRMLKDVQHYRQIISMIYHL